LYLDAHRGLVAGVPDELRIAVSPGSVAMARGPDAHVFNVSGKSEQQVWGGVTVRVTTTWKNGQLVQDIRAIIISRYCRHSRRRVTARRSRPPRR
jgi:hypothetical protein